MHSFLNATIGLELFQKEIAASPLAINSKEKFSHAINRTYFLGNYSGSEYFTTSLGSYSIL